MPLKEGTLQFDNKKVDYIKFGTGKRIMVLIPGMSFNPLKGTGLYASKKYQLFSNEFTVYLIDKIRKIPKNYTNVDISEDYAKAFEMLNIKDAYVLAISHGGVISEYLAINHPELIKKLVLGVTLAYNNDTFEKAVHHWLKLAKDNKQGELIVDTLRKTRSDEYNLRFDRLYPLIEKFSNHFKLSKYISLLEASISEFPNDRIRFIKCPVLVLGGMKDKIVTAEASYQIARKLKCPIHMYEDLGHSAYNETKDFNMKVLEFFNIM